MLLGHRLQPQVDANLRIIPANPPQPWRLEGLTVPKVRPLQGRQVFLACVSVGFTYGYSLCPASRDGGRHWTWRTITQKTGRTKSGKTPISNLCVAYP